ncbi:MAG: succinate dehydrogenase cytochrome b subunit [Bacteroidetes bacterium]|nr:succinate dehydrogenase cytochrome b subunit [Bacteroidota bacterium]
MILINYLKSTILSKFVMAVTGVILVLFVIGHCVGNLQVFLGKDAFNSYAYFLQERLGELLLIIRLGLIVAVVFHIITSVRLKFLNLGAKPTKYQVKNYVKARLTSRTMIWTGIMIFAFLTYHILHFTMGVVHPEDYNKTDYYVTNAVSVEKVDNSTLKDTEGSDECCAKGTATTAKESLIKYKGSMYKVEGDEPILSERHDAYAMVISGFQKPLVSILYIIGVIILGFHLNHAIQSAFQTLGYNNPKYFPKIIVGSTIISILLVICYISIPISILLGLVGGRL